MLSLRSSLLRRRRINPSLKISLLSFQDKRINRWELPLLMADEVGDRRRDRVTENTSRLRLDFLFRANNLEESGPFCSQTQFENSHGRPGEQQNDAESASLEGSKRARASVGGGDQMAVPPRADPRDPAVTRQQLPLRSSLWNLQRSAAQSRTHCAPKFGVRLSNCHMAVGL